MKLLNSVPLMLCAVALAACSSVDQPPSADSGLAKKMPTAAPAPLAASPAVTKSVPVDPAWLAHYEPRLREALKGSHFQVQRYNDLLLVTAPADQSFNPDRPTMLVPAALGPITQIAKLVESDRKTAVMVLGHSDAATDEVSRTLTQERARAFGAIFRMSGLHPDRLQMKGMGASMPRSTANSKEGRALNRRVEMELAPQSNLSMLLAQYEAAYPSLIASAAPEPAHLATEAKTVKSKAKATSAAKATGSSKKAKTPAKSTQVAGAHKPSSEKK